MANFNKVILLGNLTRDIELRHTQGGQALAKFGMAVNRKFTTQAGEAKEEVCFVDITAWGKQAEVLSQYVKKGSQLFVEGRLQYSTWESQEGGKKSKLEVVLENFQFVGGRGEGPATGGSTSGGGYARAGRGSSAGGGGNGGGEHVPLPSDDIPF